MDKDFFKKIMSTKDIKLPKFELKNKKMVFICIFIIVFFIGILMVGSALLKDRENAKLEYQIAQRKYMSLQTIPEEEKLKEEINKVIEEKEIYEKLVEAVNSKEFSDILNDFKSKMPISWDTSSEDVSLKTDNKDFPEYDIYLVKIKSFSGTLSQIEEFLTYVANYDKVVRVDSLKFNQNKVTGKLDGQVTLSFYFKKIEE